MRDVNAHATFRGSVRAGNQPRAHSAAREVLLPTLQARGAYNYARAVALEAALIQYRAPPEVRAWIEAHYSHGGQGYDFVLEERNGRMKVLVGGNTLACWRFANAFQAGAYTRPHFSST
jgi:hypothetical protein